MLALCKWLEQTWIGSTVRESLWLFPLIEMMHLRGGRSGASFGPLRRGFFAGPERSSLYSSGTESVCFLRKR